MRRRARRRRRKSHAERGVGPRCWWTARARRRPPRARAPRMGAIANSCGVARAGINNLYLLESFRAAARRTLVPSLPASAAVRWPVCPPTRAHPPTSGSRSGGCIASADAVTCAPAPAGTLPLARDGVPVGEAPCRRTVSTWLRRVVGYSYGARTAALRRNRRRSLPLRNASEAEVVLRFWVRVGRTGALTPWVEKLPFSGATPRQVPRRRHRCAT
jgi:hypothetical protein